MKHLIITFLCLATFISGLAQSDSRRPYQLYEEAERYYNDNLFEQAKDILDNCILRYPGYMEAYTLRAASKEQLHDEQGALTDYSAYLEHNPNNPDVVLSRGILRFHMGLYEQAREDLRRIQYLSSDETNVVLFRQNMTVDDRNPVTTMASNRHAPLVANYLGLIEFKLNNHHAALRLLDSAILLDNKEADFFVNRGLVKEAMDDPSAFIDYEIAVRLNPGHTLARHNLNAYNAKHKSELSHEERLTKTILQDSTLLYPYLERAQHRYNEKNYKGALEDYSQAAQMSPYDPEIYFARGQAKEKLEDYKGAFADYTKAIDLKEDYAKVWLSRGNVLLKLNRFEDALEDYNVAMIYYPDFGPAFYNRALAKAKLNKLPEACADLLEAQKLGMDINEKLKAQICQ